MFSKKIILFIIASLLLVTRAESQQQQSATVIELSAMPGLKFSTSRFTVKPGTQVKIVYTNTDDMSHNLLITKPGTRLDVVNQALKLDENGPAMNYIPKSAQVLWSIPVLSPNQTKTLTFTAPTQVGVYPYVCTYPGHGFTMYGAMYVSADGKMPDLKVDPNIPPSAKTDIPADKPGAMAMDHSGHQMTAPESVPLHPYQPIAPYLYRGFMDDASPAAIAVCLPQDLAYCWDAGTCKLRYAWAGGFVDNTALWKGHSDAVSKILGTIFYRDNTVYPIRIGDVNATPTVKYKGYRLINKYPEFHYTVNGADVYELIKPKTDGNGLVRTFKISGTDKPVWFVTNPGSGSEVYETSAGKWDNGRVQLSAMEAAEFSITITSYTLVYDAKRKKKP
jgi:plastocyanin